jgi:hypothetical protein
MTISRRLDEARKAFEKKDLAVSGDAQTPEAIAGAMEEQGGWTAS